MANLRKLSKYISKATYNRSRNEFQIDFKHNGVLKLFKLLFGAIGSDAIIIGKTLQFNLPDDTTIDQLLNLLDISTNIEE